LALKGQDYEAAIGYFVRAAGQNALSSEGQTALGEAYAAAGDLPAAIQAWERALQNQQTSVDLLTRLLDAHLKLKDYSAAAITLQELAALQPTDASLRYRLGLLLAARQPESALAHLAQAAEMDPSLAAKAQTVVDSIRTGSLSGDPAQTLFEAGRALASVDEWELAAEAFRQATVVRPDFVDGWAFLGEARQHVQGDFLSQPVPPELEQALLLDPSSLSANTLMALYWQRRFRFDQALAYLDKAASLYPENPALQVELGEVLALSGDLQGGLLAYQRAVELAPRDASYHRQLAGFCIRHQVSMQEVGLPAARQALLLDDQDPLNLDVMGQALYLVGDLSNAQRFFQRALQADAGFAQAHVHLGLVYIMQGERELAYQEWSLVISLAPQSPAAEQAQRLVKNYFP
jgi:tetratricopeptide (TPR) repeat protein